MPSYAAIAPIAQHRGREPQLACDLDQRPTAARQQSDRLRLELIRKMTPFLAHSTPSRSRRSLAKVSTNSGEAHWKGLAPAAASRHPLSHLRPEAGLAAVPGAQAGDEAFIGLEHAEILDARRDRSALEQMSGHVLVAGGLRVLDHRPPEQGRCQRVLTLDQ